LILDGDIDIRPGDQVLVHGDPVRVAFGQKISERRQASVARARWLARAWTRVVAGLAFMELYDVSFTSRRTL
jgi:F420-0:gamma-glutamyl ligase-like protein